MSFWGQVSAGRGMFTDTEPVAFALMINDSMDAPHSQPAFLEPGVLVEVRNSEYKNRHEPRLSICKNR